MFKQKSPITALRLGDVRIKYGQDTVRRGDTFTKRLEDERDRERHWSVQ